MTAHLRNSRAPTEILDICFCIAINGMSSFVTLMVPLCGLLLLAAGLVRPVTALDCYQCGQYNDGVGSITPCLEYSDPLDKTYLKSCPHKTDKYCIVGILNIKIICLISNNTLHTRSTQTQTLRGGNFKL